MDKEIREIIEKNLPSQVGKVLKERLEQAEKDDQSIKDQIKRNNKLIIQERELNKTISDYKKFDERNAKLDARGKEISEKERNFRVAELSIKLEEANKRADVVTEFTKGLVRNTTFRKKVFDSENQNSYTDANGNTVFPTPINKSLTETKEEE